MSTSKTRNDAAAACLVVSEDKLAELVTEFFRYVEPESGESVEQSIATQP